MVPPRILPVLFFLLIIAGCTPIDLYEKYVTIPEHAWKSGFRPQFRFTIRDTSSPYQVYFVIRHSARYNYNNIYIKVHAKQPGSDSAQVSRIDVLLATNERGWLGSGMDDIYEHRAPLTPPGEEFFFTKPGEYEFTLEQIMREDPLRHVFSVGLRIEKK